ncbi:MAG TPA: malto-oligosyltrehalose trehalohydrolase [Candidatus Binatia bacterium]|nr:malto-oligosyltrehalose trehalohydrolase [Candidatus Binatia bacterium]
MMDLTRARCPGATYLGADQCQFRVWAPRIERIDVQCVSPRRERFPLEKDGAGYHYGCIGGVGPESRYFYLLDETKERPDPASRFQPEGVHGPSQVIDGNFTWNDNGWNGIALRDFVIYELHVGTYTEAGTFDSLIDHLPALKDLGITAVELMPVGQFPGSRNWGYDGVYPFAVQNSYGGPDRLKRFVDACHRESLAVVLDVVYNHLGPEGNYFAEFAPYFTDRYRTPWGPALNFDGPYSDEVRRFLIENARYWIRDFHIDALRLDAVHAILDQSPRPFLAELSAEIETLAAELQRRIYLIPESAANDARLIRPRHLGGYGLHAVWSDDFHHSLRTLLTGEQTGYYQDYGKLEHLVSAYRHGFTYRGDYSRFHKRRHGSCTKDIPAERFVVFAQNHDQVGNRCRGDRLSENVTFEALKLAAASVILSPYIPLLFMGEEYGETAPFPYFTSHSDRALIEAVRRGRAREFFEEQGKMPDPQDEATFLQAKLLNHNRCREKRQLVLRDFYKELLQMRRTLPALSDLSRERINVIGYEDLRILFVHRWHELDHIIIVASFGAAETTISLPIPAGNWRKLLDSAEKKWHGSGSPMAEEVPSAGKVTLTLCPQSLVVLNRRE